MSRRIANEIGEIQSHPLIIAKTIEFEYNDSPVSYILNIQGPPETPYEGSRFKFVILLPEDYPFVAPILECHSNILHPSIKTGVLTYCCLDLYRWKPANKITNTIVKLYELLGIWDPEKVLCCIPEYKSEYYKSPKEMLEKIRKISFGQ